MVIKRTPRFIVPVISFRGSLGALLAITLVACGDTPADSDLAQSSPNEAAAERALMINLPSAPIDLAQAQSQQSVAPVVPPICPWLSDASANAAVDNVMTSEPMVRRAVTPDECRWNVNLGFALSIRAVPLSAVVDPSTIRYNMDESPVLEPQDGPGNNAVAILDPTFDADKPRPFAFVFNADNRQFNIRTTGVRTSIDQLRAVADEIVEALPTATPIVAASAEPTLDPCVYDGATIAALFGGTAAEALTQNPSLPNSSCKYSGIVGEAGIEMTLTFAGDPLSPPNSLDPDYALSDNFSADVYVKDMSRTGGYGSTARAYQIARPSGQIRIDLLVGQNIFPDAIAAQLVNNLIARTN
ncbi:MAG: hypothetical protein R3F50_00385 [Gammaproteobacteria bacterium]